MFESWAIVGPYPSWWLFNFLLLVLQVLHVIWSYLIARIAVKALLRGKVSPRTDLVVVVGCVSGGGYLLYSSTFWAKQVDLKLHQGKLSDTGSSIVQIFKLS